MAGGKAEGGAPQGEGCRLYLVTPPALAPASFRDILAAALDAGDVAAVQLRLKDVDDTALRRAIAALRPVAQSRGVAFLLNDRPDLAVEMGCDGAHVGQEDTPAPIARKILGDRTLGVTCHASRDLAMTAGEEGADYVAFGAFFPSPTKPGAGRADVELLAWWSELMELPSVAIGGITAENCGDLVRAGADFLAVVSAVWDHPQGAAAGVRDMNRAIAEAKP
jgi:thiamine-phosphate pyrophosphorylase